MANLILLTGAGFTHNFGAPLASQMMSIIFNYRKKFRLSDKALKLFNGDRDYENIYTKIMSEDRYSNDREPFKQIIQRTYQELDDIVRHQNSHSTVIKNISSVLLKKFTKKNSDSGKIFTLNQDLFIERFHQSNLGHDGITIPGLMNNPPPKNGDELTDKHFITIDDQRYQDGSNHDFSYFKLHGSLNWHINVDDQEDVLLVLGADKMKGIKSVPLLNDYMSVFEKELRERDTKVLIIGYGFADDHINEKLADAHDGAEFHIICPKNISDFYDDVICRPGRSDHYPRDDIWPKSYYYACNLRELFDPENGMGKHCLDRLDKNYFKQ